MYKSLLFAASSILVVINLCKFTNFDSYQVVIRPGNNREPYRGGGSDEEGVKSLIKCLVISARFSSVVLNRVKIFIILSPEYYNPLEGNSSEAFITPKSFYFLVYIIHIIKRSKRMKVMNSFDRIFCLNKYLFTSETKLSHG